MITYDKFKDIDTEVQLAVDQTLDHIQKTNQNYILLLAHGEYMSMPSRFNPYGIDATEDTRFDETRRTFFVNFMGAAYSFENGSSIVSDLNSIQLELMIYCHIWESRPLLKVLYRIMVLASGGNYPWNVTVPRQGKEDFLRNDIRQGLLDLKPPLLGNIIKNGFHSSLRNAFAHSDYYFSLRSREIRLTNFGGKAWELNMITFHEWAIKFAYSSLLSHHLLNKLHERRTRLVHDFNKDEFLIIHPISSNRFKATKIKYDQDHDLFSFVQNR